VFKAKGEDLEDPANRTGLPETGSRRRRVSSSATACFQCGGPHPSDCICTMEAERGRNRANADLGTSVEAC